MKKVGDIFVSLRARLTLLFLVFTLVLVASISFMAQRIAREALREDVFTRLGTITQLKESELNRWNENNKKVIRLLAERPLVVEYARMLTSIPEIDKGQDTVYGRLIENHFTPALEQEGGLHELSLLRLKDGMILVSTNPDQEGMYRENMDFFLRGRNETYVDQPKYELSVGAPVMHISTPVMDQKGNAIAVLVGHVDIDELSEIMAEQERLTESMETYLVNQSNLLITESRFEGQAAFRKSIFTSGVNACLQGENGQGVYADYRGIEVVGVYRWLPGWGMCILTEQDQEEAFATVASVRTTIWGVGLGILVVGGLVGFLSARGITKPLNELKRGVRAFGEGDLETRINLDAQDEIGALASAFNEMAANLRDKTKENERLFEELQGWSEELEEKVQERTTELQREIEERKRAELQLEETLQELERSNEELQRFAYVASHDLQEPLRMVTSYLQLLVRRYEDRLDGDAQEFIDFAVDGAARMKELINDLLTYSRVNTHGKEFTPLDMDRVLDAVLSNLQILIKETEARITRGPLPEIRGDPSQLRQLFQNLIVNAIKFRGGEVPEIHIAAQREEGDWVFSVKDNGIGIDEKYQDRIFVIFQRLHTDDEYKGTGIGLAVSKRIVNRHGGEIWFESEPGEGTTFYFRLPEEAVGTS